VTCGQFILNFLTSILLIFLQILSERLNPFTDEQLNLLGTVQDKFAILFHFLYFDWDAKRSAGELLAG